MARTPDFRYVSHKAGAFVLTGLVLALLGLLLAGRVQGWLTIFPRITVTLPPEGSYGLRDGAEVQIFGVVVGEVAGVDVDDLGQMVAELKITKKRYMRFIRIDSPVVIKKKFGVAGDAFIEVGRGSGREIGPEDALPALADREILRMIQDFIQRLQEKAMPTLDQIPIMVTEYARLARDFNDPEGTFRQLLGSLQRLIGGFEELMASISRGEGVAGKLLKDPALNEKVRSMMATLESALDDARAILQETRKATERLPGLLAKADAPMDRLPELLENTKELLGRLGPILERTQAMTADLGAITATARAEVADLPGLVIQVRELLRQVQLLVQGFQRHWLIRGYVPQGQPDRLLPPDAVGEEGGR